MGTAMKHPVPDWVKPSFVIFLSVRVPGCQNLEINDSLTRFDTGCFIAVAILQQWTSKG